MTKRNTQRLCSRCHRNRAPPSKRTPCAPSRTSNPATAHAPATANAPTRRHVATAYLSTLHNPPCAPVLPAPAESLLTSLPRSLSGPVDPADSHCIHRQALHFTLGHLLHTLSCHTTTCTTGQRTSSWHEVEAMMACMECRPA
jgi:hypothetical protein